MTLSDIRQAVAWYFRLTDDDLKGPSRSTIIAHPRQLAFLIAREETDRSLTQIAMAFGRTDHSTVITGSVQAKRRAVRHPIWKRHYEAVRSEARRIGGSA